MGTIRRGTRNVLRNPVRLVLVTALLGTSLMFAAAMLDINAGTQERLEEVRSSIEPTITILPARSGPEGSGVAQADGLRATLSEETLRTVTEIPSVQSVYGRIEMLYTGSGLKGVMKQQNGSEQRFQKGIDSSTVSPMVVGVVPDDPQGIRVALSPAEVVAGRELTADDVEANVALMGKALAKANGLDVGSRIDIEGGKVEIVGLYETGKRLANNSLVLPLRTMQRLYGIDGVSSATAHVVSGAEASEVIARLRETLGEKVEIRSQGDFFASMFTGTLQALEAAQRNTLSGLIVALMTAASVIVVTVFLIVRERTREIGVLKALGASNWHVIGQFGVEVLALGGVAAVAAAGLLAFAGPTIASAFDLSGVGVLDTMDGPAGGTRGGELIRGIGGSPFAAATDPLSAGLTVETLLLLLSLGVLLAVLASTISALYIARIKPAEVLRQA